MGGLRALALQGSLSLPEGKKRVGFAANCRTVIYPTSDKGVLLQKTTPSVVEKKEGKEGRECAPSLSIYPMPGIGSFKG